MINRNLERSPILLKFGFSLLVVLYNSVQSALNLSTFIEEVEDCDNTSSYEFL